MSTGWQCCRYGPSLLVAQLQWRPCALPVYSSCCNFCGVSSVWIFPQCWHIKANSARCVFANTMSASFPTHVCMCCGVCRCSVLLGLSAILLCIITLPPSSLLLHLSGRNITKDFSPNLDPKKEPMPRFLHKMGLTEEQHTFGGATSVKGKLIQGAIRT